MCQDTPLIVTHIHILCSAPFAGKAVNGVFNQKNILLAGQSYKKDHSMRIKRPTIHNYVESAACFVFLGIFPGAGLLRTNLLPPFYLYEFVRKGNLHMNTDMKRRVIGLLETYPDRKRKIDALRYELANPARITQTEQLEAMTYAHGDTEGRPGAGHISNKTLYIALNYQNKTEKLNASVVDEVAGQLYEAEQEQSRLEYYVSFLESRQADVIRRIYFEQEPQEAVAKALNISVRTVQAVKAKAVNALVELYSLTGKLY